MLNDFCPSHLSPTHPQNRCCIITMLNAIVIHPPTLQMVNSINNFLHSELVPMIRISRHGEYDHVPKSSSLSIFPTIENISTVLLHSQTPDALVHFIILDSQRYLTRVYRSVGTSGVRLLPGSGFVSPSAVPARSLHVRIYSHSRSPLTSLAVRMGEGTIQLR